MGGGAKNFLLKIFLGLKFFWTHDIFGTKIFLDPKFFFTQNFFGLKFFWTQNFFQIFLGQKKIVDPNFINVNFFRPKIIWTL